MSLRPQSASPKAATFSLRQNFSRVAELEQENNQLKRQLKQIEQMNSNEEKQKQISLLRAQLASREAELAQKDIKINELKQNLSKGNEAMKNIIPKVQKLQSIIKQQKDTITLLKSENQSLKAENTSFRTRRDASIGQSNISADNDLRQRLSKFKEALTKRNNEYKTLSTKLENLQKQNKQIIEIIKMQDTKLRQRNPRSLSSPKAKPANSNSNEAFSITPASALILQEKAQDLSLNEIVQEMIESQALDKALQENSYMKAKNDAISFQAKQIAQLQRELKDKTAENDNLVKHLSDYENLEEELLILRKETEKFKEIFQKLNASK
ncbi:hypothetical protein TRFO_36211 [Tritrichomonas foetus]|uniref:Uncharacterized protein n=1 Tax=Tritrichomonas foetus TaxID=1144522 RepID=A0A1J4JJ29_9EUKA|nr:hypothetical protein TRFO_36211 [Tritrichomonas foetus]|eukprot:OHS97557.1 hypothetical protein TRFO_36211 [Tritrichomonas foetus]